MFMSLFRNGGVELEKGVFRGNRLKFNWPVGGVVKSRYRSLLFL
jgi:hypothetical protein